MRRQKLLPTTTFDPERHVDVEKVAKKAGFEPKYFRQIVLPATQVNAWRDTDDRSVFFINKTDAEKIIPKLNALRADGGRLQRGALKAMHGKTYRGSRVERRQKSYYERLNRSVPSTHQHHPKPSSNGIVIPTVVVSAEMLLGMMKAGIPIRIEVKD